MNVLLTLCVGVLAVLVGLAVWVYACGYDAGVEATERRWTDAVSRRR